MVPTDFEALESELEAIANETGMDGKALLAATESEDVKAEYQSNTDEAMSLGVFGAPMYVFDGETLAGDLESIGSANASCPRTFNAASATRSGVKPKYARTCAPGPDAP